MDSFTSPSRRIGPQLLPPLINRNRHLSARQPLSRSVLHVPDKKHSISNSATYREKVFKSLSPAMLKAKIRKKESSKSLYSIDSLVFGKLLGQGKFGRVIQASIGTQNLAVKIMPVSEIKTAENEWEILQQISCPFLIQGIAKLQDTQHIYIVMELMENGDLFELMRKRRLRINEIQFMTAQVILALEYLHNNGIIYRDIKPENLMIDNKGHLKLIDFGFSKYIQNERATTVCGSPEYTAPEML